MADNNKLSTRIEEYSANMLKKFGSSFTYNAFIDKAHKQIIKPEGLIQSGHEDPVDFPWLEELEVVTEKIMSIASNPRTHIKVEKDVKKAEQAVKIDNYDVIETLKVPSYWKKKGDRFAPEKVYTDIFEIEYAIYENRFIINLVDKMMLFLSQVVSQLYEQIKKVGHNFIGNHVSISDMEILQDIADFGSFKAVSKSSRRSERLKEDGVTLLTTRDSAYVEALRRILNSRANVSHIRSTPFYKNVKKAKPLGDSDVHITNMLAGDPSYAPCYTFYRKLLPLLTKGIETEDPINLKAYHNFVVSNILAAFDDLDFKGADSGASINNHDDIVTFKKLHLKKGDIDCYLTSLDEDHIELYFEISKDAGMNYGENIANKKHSLVSIDLVPSPTNEYPNEEELSEYFRNKIKARLRSGYTNAFVVTAVDNTQQDDVMICSPRIYKIDANVKTMIDSCILFAEADNYIYSHICPVCGFYVDGEQEDGNCYCANCDSVYTLLSSGKSGQVKESVWIKRLKNPEGI